MVFFNPNYLNHSDNYIEANPLVTPSHIVPEMYLLPFYAILRSISNKTLGVIAMISSILILCIIPWLHLHIINTSFFRPLYKLSVYYLIIIFILLTWIGQAVVEYPFIFYGQLLTISYFSYFLLIIPIISFIEFILFIC